MLDLMNIVLKGHCPRHYLFYFIFALSTHLKTNSPVRGYHAVNLSLVVGTII